MIGATLDTKVGVALPDGQEAGTLLGVALGLAAAPGETLTAVAAALAKLKQKHVKMRTRYGHINKLHRFLHFNVSCPRVLQT